MISRPTATAMQQQQLERQQEAAVLKMVKEREDREALAKAEAFEREKLRQLREIDIERDKIVQAREEIERLRLDAKRQADSDKEELEKLREQVLTAATDASSPFSRVRGAA